MSPMLPEPTITDHGDSALRLGLGDTIGDEAHRRVMSWLAALDVDRPPFVVDVVPAYRSLLVVYDCARARGDDVRAWIDTARREVDPAARAPRRVVVPVWYDPSVGPDLADVAERHRLAVAELVARHTAPDYRVHMLGFRPGFPYLGGLDPRLATPRLPTPRVSVPAGSVGIGGAQTGVYPVPSPGGWRLIGRTPLRLFDPSRAEPFLLGVGDVVRFEAIDEARFRALEG